MSQTYKELLQQREALESAIAQARQNEISSAVSKVRELAAEYGLTVQDIFPGRGGKTGARGSHLRASDPCSGSECRTRGLRRQARGVDLSSLRNRSALDQGACGAEGA